MHHVSYKLRHSIILIINGVNLVLLQVLTMAIILFLICKHTLIAHLGYKSLTLRTILLQLTVALNLRSLNRTEIKWSYYVLFVLVD